MWDKGEAFTKAFRGQRRAIRLFGSQSAENYRGSLERLAWMAKVTFLEYLTDAKLLGG